MHKSLYFYSQHYNIVVKKMLITNLKAGMSNEEISLSTTCSNNIIHSKN